MKVIITGGTGYIGAEVLSECVKNPRITSIIALSRRPLPQYQGEPKVQVQIVPDFAKFDANVVESWKGAEACLWCLGLAIPPTREMADLLALVYPQTFVKTFAEVSTAEEQRGMRFVLLSGTFVERSQTKSLWFLQEERRLRGRTEIAVLDGTFDCPRIPSYVVRPAAVVSSPWLLKLMSWTGYLISIRTLAAAIIDVGVSKAENDNRVLENTDLIERGRIALQDRVR